MNRQIDKLSVIYIAGYGRSGSTVLDVALSKQLGAVSCGELTNLFRWALEDRTCMCGDTIRNCQVWAPAVEGAQAATGLSLRSLADISSRAELRPQNKSDRRVWVLAWDAVFASLMEHGFNTVVDSSKSAGGRDRLRLFQYTDRAEVGLVVQLVRDIRGVVFSSRRGDNRKLERGFDEGSRFWYSVAATIGWLRANRRAFIQRSQSSRSIVVRYEEFVSDAMSILEDVANRLDRSNKVSHPAELHTVAGNRVARSGWDGAIRDDEAWRTDLPRSWWIIGTIISRAGSRYARERRSAR